MTDVMAYQYPPPPNGSDMDMPPSGFISSYSTSSPMEVRPIRDSVLSLKERKTLSKVMKLKRSVSSPSVKQHQSHQQQQVPPPLPTTPQAGVSSGDPSGMGAAGEKRRNKLGYHRTSVACGHCRRRKIRCIPSPSDVQGRCVNCIRLKKECSFYPVDQQPPTATASKPVARSSTGHKIASASSSPAMPHPADPYHGINMPPIQTMPPPMKPPGPEGYSGDSKLPLSAESYEQPLTNWMADASPSSSKPGDISTSWRGYPSESPISQSFSPYTPHAPPSSTAWGTPVGAEAANRDEMAWSSYPTPQTRSMSFGGEASHYQDRGYDRKTAAISADMYPGPIGTSMPTMEAIPGTTLEHHVSLPAGAAGSAYSPWQQQPYPYAKPNDPYGGWYDGGGNAPLGSDDGVAPGGESQVPGAGMYQYATGR